MTFQEIHEEFSIVKQHKNKELENPLVTVFTTVIIELSRAGLELEERMQKLEAENANLRRQFEEASSEPR